jgi:hypothetical protein
MNWCPRTINGFVMEMINSRMEGIDPVDLRKVM